MRALPTLSALFQASAMVMFALVLIATPYTQESTYVRLISTGYLIAASLTMAATITSERRGGVDFLIAFFFLFFVAVPSRVQVGAGVFPFFARLAPGDIVLGYALLSVSQLCYAIAQGLALRSAVPPARDTYLTVEAAQFYTKWAWGIAGFSVLCGVAAGPTNLLLPRFELGEVDFGGLTQQFMFMARATSLLAFVMIVYLARFLEWPGLRRQNMWVLVLFVPIFLVINYPPALPRFVLFGTLIAVSCTYLDFQKPGVKLASCAVAVLFLFFVFPFSKQIAQANFSLATFVGSVGTTNLGAYMLRVDFDGFMQTVSSVQYLERELGGLRWGYNFFGAALFFVPRALWASKPIDTGEIVSVALGYRYNNVACPLPAEALMAFGFAGPLIVFGLLGWFVTRVEIRAGFPKTGNCEFPRFVLYAILMGFIVIILRGAINGVAPQFASGFFAFAIMMVARNNRLVWRQAV